MVILDLWLITTRLRGWSRGQGWLLYTIYLKLACIVCYVIQPDWSLLLLVNTGNFHWKQSVYVNVVASL